MPVPVPRRRFFKMLAALTGAERSWAPSARAAEPRPRRVRESRLGITVEAPPGWTISQRTGFAETVFLLFFPDGSRISLSAENTRLHSTSELIEQNRRGLLAQGFSVSNPEAGPGGWRSVDLSPPEREEAVRQLYLVRPVEGDHQALVLTLVTPTRSLSAHLAALSFVVERMTMDSPAPAPAQAGATPGNGRSAPSGGRAGLDGRNRDAGTEDSRDR